MLTIRGCCYMPPRWLCTPSSHVQTMPTESALEQPRVDATNQAVCGSSPRWRRAALSVGAACQSTTAARNSLAANMIIAVATTVTWTAPTGGRSEAPEGALRALKWTPRATPIDSQKSKHDSARAIFTTTTPSRTLGRPTECASMRWSLEKYPTTTASTPYNEETRIAYRNA